MKNTYFVAMRSGCWNHKTLNSDYECAIYNKKEVKCVYVCEFGKKKPNRKTVRKKSVH